MKKSKIDWCDSTWNPVTGCRHGCEYCYAKRITDRFGKNYMDLSDLAVKEGLHVLDTKFDDTPYPFGFEPTFHAYRLGNYANDKGRNIFVCSMADLFGDWVPDSWIREVFGACKEAPQHNYLFLTKNPKRYAELKNKNMLPAGSNMWYGFSVTDDYYGAWYSDSRFIFASIEPILGEVKHIPFVDWIIIGAETGNRKDKVVPKRRWIEHIVSACEEAKIPVFMKESLSDIWGEPLIQEFPTGLQISTSCSRRR